MRRLLAGLVVLAVAAVILVLVLSGGGGGNNARRRLLADEQEARNIAASVVRGGSAVLMAAQQAPAGAQALQIRLPVSLMHPPTPAGSSATAAVFAGAGWRGALIAAVAATRIPGLTQFVTTDGAGAQAPGSAFYLDGSVRMAPGQNPAAAMTKLDSVTAAAARRQLDDSLAVLRAGLPPGSITQATISEIPVDAAHEQMAFDVELRVPSLARLTGHLGDILQGLATGLAPGLESTVEGLAIHVVDASGRNAGSWMATRAQQGTTVVDPRLRAPRVMVPTLHFTDETGGPNPLPSAHAGP